MIHHKKFNCMMVNVRKNESVRWWIFPPQLFIEKLP